MVKYCAYCGAALSMDARYCDKCGCKCVPDDDSKGYMPEEPVYRTEPARGYEEPAKQYAEPPQPPKQEEKPVKKANPMIESCFQGSMLEMLGHDLAIWFLSLFTLGIAMPWLICWKQRWICRNTYINGLQQSFNGTGGALFGQYIVGILLSIITLCIYTPWFAMRVARYMVEHTSFDEISGESRFEGTGGRYFGMMLATFFLLVISLGFATWALYCWHQRWFKQNSMVSGVRLWFDGTAGQYFGKTILWIVLTIVTLGIYSLWISVNELKWATSKTNAAE